jgi:hypothetical protein
MSNQTTTEDFLLGRMLAFARINEELTKKVKELQSLVDKQSECKTLQEDYNVLMEKYGALWRKHKDLSKKYDVDETEIKRGRGRPRKVAQ